MKLEKIYSQSKTPKSHDGSVGRAFASHVEFKPRSQPILVKAGRDSLSAKHMTMGAIVTDLLR